MRPGPKGSAAEVEKALALRDVMQHAVRVQREITDPKPLSRRRAKTVWTCVLCIPLLALSVYSWVARPAFIWGASQHMSPARQEANTRVAMYLLARRIEIYRRSFGSYPASLGDVQEGGGGAMGISYVPTDSTFELRSTENGGPVVYRSSQNADAFLGNSLTVLNGPLR